MFSPGVCGSQAQTQPCLQYAASVIADVERTVPVEAVADLRSDVCEEESLVHRFLQTGGVCRE